MTYYKVSCSLCYEYAKIKCCLNDFAQCHCFVWCQFFFFPFWLTLRASQHVAPTQPALIYFKNNNQKSYQRSWKNHPSVEAPVKHSLTSLMWFQKKTHTHQTKAWLSSNSKEMRLCWPWLTRAETLPLTRRTFVPQSQDNWVRSTKRLLTRRGY